MRIDKLNDSDLKKFAKVKSLYKDLEEQCVKLNDRLDFSKKKRDYLAARQQRWNKQQKMLI